MTERCQLVFSCIKRFIDGAHVNDLMKWDTEIFYIATVHNEILIISLGLQVNFLSGFSIF